MRTIMYGVARMKLAGALKLVPCPKISGTGRWQLLGVLLLVFSTSALRAQEEPLQALEVRTLDSILVTVRSNHPMLQGYDYKVKAMNAYAEGARSWMSPPLGAGTLDPKSTILHSSH